MPWRAPAMPRGGAAAGTGAARRAAGSAPSTVTVPAPAGRDADEPKRMCTGKCREYRAKRPAKGGRYEAGHGRCQTCDIWIDHRGCHMHNGRPAVKGSIGWYCNCCNFRIRRNPRNTEYKQRLRHSRGRRAQGRAADAAGGRAADAAGGAQGRAAAAEIDLSYFNKRRARMLRDLGRVMAKSEGGSLDVPDDLVEMLEDEFDASLAGIVWLARSESPNKASLIAELERIRIAIGSVPTRQEMKKNGARFPLSAYDDEFESWGHLLDRLGYDPWYRH